MAVAVSKYSSHVSFEGLGPTHQAPVARFAHINGSTFSRLEGCTSTFCPDLQLDTLDAQLSPVRQNTEVKAPERWQRSMSDTTHTTSTLSVERSIVPAIEVNQRLPFQKWMGRLQKRNRKRDRGSMPYRENLSSWLLETGGLPGRPRSVTSYRCQSSSGSSFNLIAGVRSATMSLISSSDSQISSQRLSQDGHEDMDQDLDREAPGPRCSTPIPEQLDPGGLCRARKRRRILEELISTEQNYVDDLRLLLNVGLCERNLVNIG